METVFRARYVFPVDRPPIEDGAICIDLGGVNSAGLIRKVGRYSGDWGVSDLGNAAIVPAFVNAHTHLEFSDLDRPLGEPGISLPWWIRAVISHRAEKNEAAVQGTDSAQDRGDPIQKGVEESARCGVVTIGDIATRTDFIGTQLNIWRYFELRAFRKRDVEACIDRATQVLGKCDGLSPHAPYTVHQSLLNTVVELSKVRSTPLVMHLAETREELEFLRTAEGPFRDLLEERMWWEPGAVPLGQRPLDYLRQLCKAPRSIIIHGNYLDEEEHRFLCLYRDRISVVYCPRTHDFFRHEAYPLRSMLSHRVLVALGTDSRASNADLDIRKEMQFVIEHHGISPEQALRMGTINGAAAMGLDAISGTLTEGKYANVAVIQLPNRRAADPHELLFDPDARVVATISRGRVVFSEHPALTCN